MHKTRIVGLKRGRIRELVGYKKHYHIPDQSSATSQDFVRKTGHKDVEKAAENLHSKIRNIFGYKRRDFYYYCENSVACIKTPDFDLELKLDQCTKETKDYILSTEVVELKNDCISADERFHACFTQHCDQLILDFENPIEIEDKIDAIEEIDELAQALNYNPDASSFSLRLIALDLLIEVSEFEITFRLLSLCDLGKLLDYSQKAFDILTGAKFKLRLRQN